MCPMMKLVKLPGRFSTAEVDGDLVMIDLASGKFFALKGVALRIWDALDRTDDLEGICEELQAHYDVDADRCRADVLAFGQALVDAGFATAS